MKLSRLPVLLSAALFAAAAGVPSAWALNGIAPAVGAPRSLAAALHFDHMALGNVARLLSARFSTPVTLAAGAKAPISGDFSGFNVRQALDAAAQQAGLVVVPLGADDAAGFSLMFPPDAAKTAAAPDAVVKSGAEVRTELELADRRRELLLRKRAALLEDAARIDQ
jgi:hypothetical protein